MLRHLLVLAWAFAACATTPPAPPAPAAAHKPTRQATPQLPAAGALDVHVLDVGQGDGILIVGPQGKTVLLDAGPRKAAKHILEFCQRQGINRIDVAVLSHAHLDHMGGFFAILETLPVGEILDPGFPHTTKTYARFLDAVEAMAIPYRLAREGMTIDLGGDATFTFLAPEEPLFEGTRSDPNANSVVARIDRGNICMVLTGDAELETEERLLEHPSRLRCAILKVAHHGSRHSSSEDWLEAVQPEIAVISAGRRNRYGHPAPATLRRLRLVGANVYRTDEDGDVLIRTDGRQVSIRTKAHDTEAPQQRMNASP